MKGRDRRERLRFVQDRIRELHDEVGGPLLTPAQRRSLRGKWFRSAPQFGRRAAFYRDVHAADLDDVPFGGAEIEAAFQDAEEQVAYVLWLEGLLRGARDRLLRSRSRAYDMGTGVLDALQYRIGRPFADEKSRIRLTGTVRRLREHLESKNQKISAAKKKPGKLPRNPKKRRHGKKEVPTVTAEFLEP